MSDGASPQPDPAMLELFQAEMDTHVPVLSNGLMLLEKGQAGAREIEGMMRAAHSIKGAARIVGLDVAVRVAHSLEDCFTAAKSGKIVLTAGSVDVLLEGVDTLQRVCSSDSGVDATVIQPLLERVNRIRDGAPAPARTPTAPSQGQPQLVAATVRTEEPGIILPAVLDTGVAASLRTEMLDTLSLTPERVQLDFSHVSQVSAQMLALVVALVDRCNRAQPAVRLAATGVRDPVAGVLRAAGIAGSLGVGR